MRLPYIDPNTSPTFSEDQTEARAILDRVSARRAPRPLQPLDLALLHSPPVADGWNSFLGAVRTKTSLSDDIREIAICRVAICNGAWYEWGHHAPLAKAGGVTDEGMEILKMDKCEKGKGDGLSEKQWATVRFTDEMTRNVKVPDEVFDELRKWFNEKEIVELTATVSGGFIFARIYFGLPVYYVYSTQNFQNRQRSESDSAFAQYGEVAKLIKRKIGSGLQLCQQVLGSIGW
jgi:alkylhydroperoxidase family enzyme